MNSPILVRARGTPRRPDSGFSLVEMMVTIIILGVVMSVLITILMGAMRSIASSFKRRFDDVFLESEVLVCDVEGHEASPLDNVPSNEPPADQGLIQMDEERRITGLFANDLDAILVLRGIFDGAKRGEIMQKYGLIEKQYTAAVKRIRLKLFGRKKT